MRVFILGFLFIVFSGFSFKSQNELHYNLDYNEFLNSDIAKSVIKPQTFEIEIMQIAFFHATNEVRAKYKRKLFKYSPELRDAAQYHSTNMIKDNFFSHINSSDKQFKTSELRIKGFGFMGSAWGENCDLNYIELHKNESYAVVARKMVKHLMSSKTHRQNILFSDYTELGCGAAIEPKTKNGILYIKSTQCFGQIP